MSASDRAAHVTEPAPPRAIGRAPGLDAPYTGDSAYALLIAERSASAASPALTGQQVHMLKAFTAVWNDDRARRGVAPITAHEALTLILQTALDLVGARGIGT